MNEVKVILICLAILLIFFMGVGFHAATKEDIPDGWGFPGFMLLMACTVVILIHLVGLMIANFNSPRFLDQKENNLNHIQESPPKNQ